MSESLFIDEKLESEASDKKKCDDMFGREVVRI